ncbi:DarT ssDNA thymidine ADP-ribosyltransferase family protein [Poseidonibacter antarcticus]|uniref:DarT ssDNA thymidine ADP-ribosyltransferase family protein n=1 Tax=Poseidonibacter antarcticus TaxID=2478538 RepID=UPI0013CF105C|nr:DarT ssDNA thymidine ADP-ribosyltransferase family protein [Poseidonibacter antarcticus]
MSIRETLSNYGINSIYHFTDESNLRSIEEYGIQSLSNIIKQSIDVSRFGAESLSHTLDIRRGLDKYVHLSFIKDHPMYHTAKKRNSIIKPVWIELDVSILFDEDTIFCDKVANQNNSNLFKLNNILEFIDFQTLVYEKDFWTRIEARKAEIMALNNIQTNKIKGITYGN